MYKNQHPYSEAIKSNSKTNGKAKIEDTTPKVRDLHNKEALSN